jgi:ABC-type Na+ efflux pump, permease component
MKENFRGWTTVYGFTFRQSAKGVGFKLVTILIALIIIGAIITANIIMAKPDQKKAEEASPIKSVFVLDDSGLQATDYKKINPDLMKDPYKNIEYITVTNQTREEVLQKASSEGDRSIAVIITASEGAYQMEAVVPANSIVAKSQANALLTLLSDAFKTNKLLQSGLSQAQLNAFLTPEVTSYTDIGENTNKLAFIIKLIAPLLFSFMLYMMLLLYGQTISKSVSNEKTSKLMETLLTSIHPYALLTGKILAVTSMALLQFVTWILACFIGLYGGNAIAHTMYPDYQSSVITIINFFKDNIGETALSAPAIILAILFFCVGFLFYSVIAGLAGCMVSKPEDAASTQSLFVFPVLISWMLVYFPPLSGNYDFVKVCRYIPFTAPFCVPSDLITGTIGIGEGVLTLAIIAIFTVLFIILSGRIYKGLILYNGQKPSLKMIGNILKNNH